MLLGFTSANEIIIIATKMKFISRYRYSNYANLSKVIKSEEGNCDCPTISKLPLYLQNSLESQSLNSDFQNRNSFL